MKLNHDCIRDFLIYIEENSLLVGYVFIENLELKNYEMDEVHYAATKLIEAGYLNGKVQYAGPAVYSFPISSISWEGHKFLDNIRDDGVWKDTKKVLSNFTSTSIGIVENIASQVITNLITKQLGID